MKWLTEAKKRRVVPLPVPVMKLDKPFNTKDFWGLRTLKITPTPSPVTVTSTTPTHTVQMVAETRPSRQADLQLPLTDDPYT